MTLAAFDGGGVRGVLPLVWAEYLEAQLGRPLGAAIDVFAGTSAGAMLACGFAAGLSATALLELFTAAAPRIFPHGWRWLTDRCRRSLANRRLSAPLYASTGLAEVLAEVFGEARFGDLPRRVLVPVYDVVRQEALVLDSERPGAEDLLVRTVCQASAAAPSYFPAVPFALGNRQCVGVDGGVAANNPTLVALAVVGHEAPVVLSFGTGQRTRAVASADAVRFGPLAWLARGNLIGLLLDGPSDITHECTRRLATSGRYFRFQTPLVRASDDLDDSSPDNLGRLASDARAYLADGGDLALDLAATAIREAPSVAAA